MALFILLLLNVPHKPINIVCMLDNSPSVYKKYDPTHQRKEALLRTIRFLKTLNLDINFSYISFGDPARVIIPLKNVTEIDLNILKKTGNFFESYTNFYDAFKKAINQFPESRNSRNILILITDGQPWPKEGSRPTNDEVRKKLLGQIEKTYLDTLITKRISLFTFLLSRNLPVINKFWEKFSIATAGNLFYFNNPSDIERLIAEILKLINYRPISVFSIVDSSLFQVPPFIDYLKFYISGYNCTSPLIEISSPEKVVVSDTLNECFKIITLRRPVKGQWKFKIYKRKNEKISRIIFNIIYGPTYLKPVILNELPEIISNYKLIKKIKFRLIDQIKKKRLSIDTQKIKLKLVSKRENYTYSISENKDSTYVAVIKNDGKFRIGYYKLILDIDDPTFTLKKFYYIPVLKFKKIKIQEFNDTLSVIGYLKNSIRDTSKIRIFGTLMLADTSVKLNFTVKNAKLIESAAPLHGKRVPDYVVLNIKTQYMLPDTTITFPYHFVYKFRGNFSEIIKNLILIFLSVALIAVIISRRLYIVKILSYLAVLFLKLSNNKFLPGFFIKRAMLYGFKKSTDLISHMRVQLRYTLSSYMNILSSFGDNLNLYEFRFWATGNEIFRQAMALNLAESWRRDPLKFFSDSIMLYQHYPHDVFLYSAFQPLTEIEDLLRTNTPRIKTVEGGIDPELPEFVKFENVYDIAMRISRLYNPLTNDKIGCNWLYDLLNKFYKGESSNIKLEGETSIWYDDITEIFLRKANPNNIISLVYYFADECEKKLEKYEVIDTTLRAYFRALYLLGEELGILDSHQQASRLCRDWYYSSICQKIVFVSCLIYLNELRIDDEISFDRCLSELPPPFMAFGPDILNEFGKGVYGKFAKIIKSILRYERITEINSNKLTEWMNILKEFPLPETNFLIYIIRRWQEWIK